MATATRISSPGVIANTIRRCGFSSRGWLQDEGVALPLAAPQARGKALINLLPLQQNETITTILPLPEDETTWQDLNVMFSTSMGDVRRNDLSDFVEVRQNGKIAMKLDEGTQIVGVGICTENDNVLLTTAGGQAIRFPVGDVRVFKGRESTGVRGSARWTPGDLVASASCRSCSGRTRALSNRPTPSAGEREAGPEDAT